MRGFQFSSIDLRRCRQGRLSLRSHVPELERREIGLLENQCHHALCRCEIAECDPDGIDLRVILPLRIVVFWFIILGSSVHEDVFATLIVLQRFFSAQFRECLLILRTQAYAEMYINRIPSKRSGIARAYVPAARSSAHRSAASLALPMSFGVIFFMMNDVCECIPPDPGTGWWTGPATVTVRGFFCGSAFGMVVVVPDEQRHKF